MQNKNKVQVAIFCSLRVMIFSSLMAALSIVFGKYLAIPGGQMLRFSFENLPILFSGILFGPLVGAAVGIVADLVGCVLVGYAINPIITVGAACMGLIGGALWRFTPKRFPLALRLGISVGMAHLIGSVLVKSYGVAAYYSIPFWQLLLWRLLNYVIVGVLEYIVLYLLLKQPTMRRLFEKMTNFDQRNGDTHV